MKYESHGSHEYNVTINSRLGWFHTHIDKFRFACDFCMPYMVRPKSAPETPLLPLNKKYPRIRSP